MAQVLPVLYPVQFSVDHAERQSRWKALFRLPLALPALLFAGLALYTALLALPIMWLAILVRGRIPRWLFDYQVGVERFNVRVQSYFSLLTDVYPAFDGEYPVHYEVAYPERVSRWKVVIWKFAAGLPQWIVVSILQYASFAIVAVGWLVILFTGQFPKGLHEFVVGVMRWRQRVYAYSLSLTDEYPPYSLSAEAPATAGGAYVASSAAGALVIGGAVAGIVALIIVAPFGEERVVQVSYEQLAGGSTVPGEYALFFDNGVSVDLSNVRDPADPFAGFIVPDEGERLLMFEMQIINGSGQDFTVYRHDYDLMDSNGGHNTPIAVVIDGHRAPREIPEGDLGIIQIVFETGAPGAPRELRYSAGRTDRFGDSAGRLQTIVYEFE